MTWKIKEKQFRPDHSDWTVVFEGIESAAYAKFMSLQGIGDRDSQISLIDDDGKIKAAGYIIRSKQKNS